MVKKKLVIQYKLQPEGGITETLLHVFQVLTWEITSIDRENTKLTTRTIYWQP